jgi:hypothetical protein
MVQVSTLAAPLVSARHLDVAGSRAPLGRSSKAAVYWRGVLTDLCDAVMGAWSCHLSHRRSHGHLLALGWAEANCFRRFGDRWVDVRLHRVNPHTHIASNRPPAAPARQIAREYACRRSTGVLR